MSLGFPVKLMKKRKTLPRSPKQDYLFFEDFEDLFFTFFLLSPSPVYNFKHSCNLNALYASCLEMSWLVLTVTGVLLPCRGERAGSPARSITGLQCSLQRMRVRSSSPVSLPRSGAVSTWGGRPPSSLSGPLFSLSCRSMDYKQESIRTSSTVYSNSPGYKVGTERLVAIHNRLVGCKHIHLIGYQQIFFVC